MQLGGDVTPSVSFGATTTNLHCHETSVGRHRAGALRLPRARRSGRPDRDVQHRRAGPVGQRVLARRGTRGPLTASAPLRHERPPTRWLDVPRSARRAEVAGPEGSTTSTVRCRVRWGQPEAPQVSVKAFLEMGEET
jgi:hypothetical protein